MCASCGNKVVHKNEGKGKALKSRIIHSVKNLENSRKHKTSSILGKLNK